ncbi:MAG TPA: DUF4136 domain-containing protein [Vicinamibacterales bacterium]
MLKKWYRIVPVVVIAILIAMQPVLAKVKVQVDFDPKFDFKPIRTWGWNPKGPGQLKMARSQNDNEEAMQKRVEPLILESVATEMARRGLQEAPGGPDLFVTYWVLLSTSTTAQTLGQFLPGTTAWALPPFEQVTQSLKLANSGALVIDMSDKSGVIWRGVARADIDFDVSEQKRQALVRDAVRELLSKFPPKGKK